MPGGCGSPRRARTADRTVVRLRLRRPAISTSITHGHHPVWRRLGDDRSHAGALRRDPRLRARGAPDLAGPVGRSCDRDSSRPRAGRGGLAGLDGAAGAAGPNAGPARGAGGAGARHRADPGPDPASLRPESPQLEPSGSIAACSPRAILRELVRRLRTNGPVSAQGVAMVRVLLTDGAGPLHYGDGDLRLAVRAAMLALDPPSHWS